MSKDNATYDTAEEFRQAKDICRSLYLKKLEDYGASWHIMRPSSITDQLLIKARRIRSIEEKGFSKVNEGIEPEFIGIVNYAIIGLIQLQKGCGESMPAAEAIEAYDYWLNASTKLMDNKNHDYDEAWRQMRVSSFTDIILQKIMRTKEIEDHHGVTMVSEGIDANYMDMVNYALFAIIKLVCEKDGQ